MNPTSSSDQTKNLIEKVKTMNDMDYLHFNSESFVGKNGDLFLFDETGKLLYTRDTLFYSDFLKTELAYIPEYNSNLSYSLSQYDTPKGEERFVLTNELIKDDGLRDIQGYILMDKNYQIISSSYEVNRESLSKEEISYLTGNNDSQSLIRKYTFNNSSGQKRILVFTTPSHHQMPFYEPLQKLSNLWFYFIPLYSVIVIVMIIGLMRSIQTILKPLENIINHPYKMKSIFLQEKPPINVFHDIANRYESLYDELVQCEWERTYLEDRKNQLLADISHDLRTPITVIQGYSRALKDGIVPEAEVDKYLQTIYKKSERVAQLLSTFHEYSLLHHPEMPIHLVDSDISTLLQVFLANKYQELELAGIELTADFPEYPIYCKLDEPLFCRAIENLINNSIKYNESGISIIVKIEKHEHSVTIQVGDSGIGIPDAIADKLFLPFVTGDASRTLAHGSGLGLSITKKIIVSHSGTIEYEKGTQEHGGTNFIIKLPLSN